MDFFLNFHKKIPETLLILLYLVAKVNQKDIRNDGFRRFLNKLQKINTEEKGSLHQWLQGVLFVLYACNAGPVHGTEISESVVAIIREFSFTLELSPVKLRKGNSEGQQDLDQFEAASPFLFIQRELFNILVS